MSQGSFSMAGISNANSDFNPTSHMSGSTVVGNSLKEEEMNIGGCGGERFVGSHLTRKITA